MQQITIKGGQILPLSQALGDLANNRLPFRLAVRVRHMAAKMEEYLKAWQDDLKPYLDEYGEDGVIEGREKIEAFQRASEPLFTEECEIEIDTLSLTELESAFEGRDIDMNPQSIEILVSLGVILD